MLIFPDHVAVGGLVDLVSGYVWCKGRAGKAAEAGKRGARARAEARTQAAAQAVAINGLPGESGTVWRTAWCMHDMVWHTAHRHRFAERLLFFFARPDAVSGLWGWKGSI